MLTLTFDLGIPDNLPPADVAILRRIGDLVTAANEGKITGREETELRRLLREHPHVYGRLSDLGAMVRESILQERFKDGAGSYELIQAQLAKQAASLGYETATGLERMLIDEVLTAYIHKALCDQQAYAVTRSDCTIERAAHWQKRARSSAARFERAMLALTRARRMLAETAFIGAKTEAALRLAELAAEKRDAVNPKAKTKPALRLA